MLQIWSIGHTAPVHASTHLPAWQTKPAVQLAAAHAVSTHLPLIKHVCPLGHIWHWQSGMQAPLSQTWPIGHITPAHGLTQVPRRQTWPMGHVTPLQASMHLPLEHHCPCGHVTPTQLASMHTVSQTLPVGHAPSWHFGTHCAP